MKKILLLLISLFVILSYTDGFHLSVRATPNLGFRVLKRQLVTARESVTPLLGSRFAMPTTLTSKFASTVKPSASKALIAMNAAVYIGNLFVPSLAKSMMKIDSMVDQGQFYRLLTAVFVHGSLYHLVMNSLSLLRMGSSAEKMFGSLPFIGIYLLAGFLANSMTYFLGTSPVSAGASSSIYGLSGAYTVFYARNKMLLGNRADQALSAIMQSMLSSILMSAVSSSVMTGGNIGKGPPGAETRRGGIDHVAHLGGFLGGAICSYLFGPRYILRKGVLVNRPLIGKYGLELSSISMGIRQFIPSVGGYIQKYLSNLKRVWTKLRREEAVRLRRHQ